jgi:two-component system response regulator YesN
MMPYMNGPDAFKAIRKIDPAMRFIMMSGFINKNDLKDVMNETLTAFVQKPFSDEQLLSAIHSLSATV